MRRYPHQLSGGQQQRVLIAMAMLNNPSLLIMDEPTTALDVTVEAAVLDLIAELQERYHTATLYISHNLGVVARVSRQGGGDVRRRDRRVRPPPRRFSSTPMHPYTMGLMRCLPDVDAPKGTRTLHPIAGRVPSPDRPARRLHLLAALRAGQAEVLQLHSTRSWARSRPGIRCAACARRIGRVPNASGETEVWPAAPAQTAPIKPGHGAECRRRLKVYYPVPFKTVGGLFGLEKRQLRARLRRCQLRRCVAAARWASSANRAAEKAPWRKAIVGLEPLCARARSTSWAWISPSR